jgi:hypothetical protein
MAGRVHLHADTAGTCRQASAYEYLFPAMPSRPRNSRTTRAPRPVVSSHSRDPALTSPMTTGTSAQPFGAVSFGRDSHPAGL